MEVKSPDEGGLEANSPTFCFAGARAREAKKGTPKGGKILKVKG
jgi:hypothetical protein